MGVPRSAVALTATIALLTGSWGCFGYNKSAKRWAYAGDAVLIAAGGATIALDGALIAGAVLAAAGLFGILFNATRDDVKTSR